MLVQLLAILNVLALFACVLAPLVNTVFTNMNDYACHGRMNYKDTEPYMSAFLQNWPVNGLCGIVFNRFYRLEILFTHGCYFWPSLGTVAPMDEGTILVYCCPSTFFLTSSPLPKLYVQYIQIVCGCGGGGVELCCRPYSAGVSHSVSDQIQNLKYCFSTLNKWPVKTTLRGWCL